MDDFVPGSSIDSARRTFLEFDTSAIPANAVISGTVVRLDDYLLETTFADGSRQLIPARVIVAEP